MTLRDALADWTDLDVAAYLLGRALRLMGEDVRFAVEAKHVFWSDHPIGNMLYDTLHRLVGVGVLLYREEPDYQCRWNPGFRGDWEMRRANTRSARAP